MSRTFPNLRRVVSNMLFPQPKKAKGRQSNRVRLTVEPLEDRTLMSFGGFAPPQSVNVGFPQNGIAVGDINRDGCLDLVAPWSDDWTVRFFLGDCKGEFPKQPNPDYVDVPWFPRSPVLEDFNRDGKLDLAVMGSGVHVFLGNGDGTFSQRQDLGDLSSLAVGDFNGDGYGDLASGDLDSFDSPEGKGPQAMITVWLNDRTGHFPPENTRKTPVPDQYNFPASALDVGYINDDRYADLVVAGTSKLYVLVGKGDGTFEPKYKVGGQPTDVKLGDMNGDGNLDFIVALESANKVVVGTGDGLGGFTLVSFNSVGNGPHALDVGYVDDDKLLDVVTANGSSGNVTLLHGKGDGTFDWRQDYLTGDPEANSNQPWDVIIADLNRDGLPDLVVAKNFISPSFPGFGDSSRNVTILLGKPASPSGSISGTVYEDVNGNRKQDPGEPGIPNRRVLLDNSAPWDQFNAGDQETYTDPSGNYRFDGLGCGPHTWTSYKNGQVIPHPCSWRVVVDKPQGWQGSSIVLSHSLDSGQALTINFSWFRLGSITGQVFEDINGNGVKEAGEQGLAARVVYIDINQNGRLDDVEEYYDSSTDPLKWDRYRYLDTNRNRQLEKHEISTGTDANGFYRLANLWAGSYGVREVIPSGWVETTPQAGSHMVTTVSGTQATGKDFGNFKLFSISGQVYADALADGKKDATTDKGLANVTVFLDMNNNGKLDAGERSTTTDDYGNYQFADLGPGTYYVRTVPPTGWRQTSSNPPPIAARSGKNIFGTDFGYAPIPIDILAELLEELV